MTTATDLDIFAVLHAVTYTNANAKAMQQETSESMISFQPGHTI